MFSEIHSNSSATHFLLECGNFKAVIYIWSFVSLSLSIVGFPASFSLLWEMFKAYRRGKNPITPNDLFILNLTIMDTVFLVGIPFGALNIMFIKNEMIINVCGSLYSLSTCGRPFMMSCICLDCYIAVVHPVVYHQRKSLTPRIVAISVVWSLTLIIGVGFSLSRTLFMSSVALIQFSIPLTIIGICDGFIIWTLLKSDPCRRNIHPQKRRAIQTLIYSLVMAVISYIPPFILAAFGDNVTNVQVFICTVNFPITVTSTLGSCLMPVLSLYNIGKLRCLFSSCKS